MKTQAEVERKYEVVEGAVMPALTGLAGSTLAGVGIDSVAHEEEVELEAEYFDTATGDLAARRITLRRRRGGEDEGWHIKLPADEGRMELHWPLDGAGSGASAPPREVLEPVLAIVRDRRLDVIARIRTRRTITRLLDGDLRTIVELADDTVSATDTSDGTLRIWREWEVELADGAPDTRPDRSAVLDRMEELLSAAGATPAASGSKLASALGRTGLGAPERPRTPLDRGSAASEVLLVALTALVHDIERLDPLVRLDEPDAVHQLRTRVRRVRSLLASYREVFDAEATASLRESLAWFGGVLGEARDAEVMRDRIADLVDSARGADSADVSDAVRDDSVSGWEERHAAAQASVVEVLSGERYFRLLDALDDVLLRPALGARAFDPVSDVVPAVLRKELSRVRRRAARADAQDPGGDRIGLLHATRKAAKRLRYAAEAVSTGDAAVFGRRVRRIGRAAERVHDLLGEHRDSMLLQDHLRESAPDSTIAFDYGVLWEFERRRGAAALEAYPDARRALLGLRRA